MPYHEFAYKTRAWNKIHVKLKESPLRAATILLLTTPKKRDIK